MWPEQNVETQEDQCVSGVNRSTVAPRGTEGVIKNPGPIHGVGLVYFGAMWMRFKYRAAH